MLTDESIPLFLVCRGNHLVDSLDEDITLWSDESTEQADQICHGLVYRSTKDPRVQVARRPTYCDFVIRQPS